MARSEAHETWYRVGSLSGKNGVAKDVYWQPGSGYACQEESEQLQGVVAGNLDEVNWFDRVEDYEALVDAADSNAGLLHAMGADLVRAFYDMADDMVFADECEAEKRATRREGAGF